MANQRFAFLKDRLGGDPYLFDLDTFQPAAPAYKEFIGTSGLRGQLVIRDGDSLIEQSTPAPLSLALYDAMKKAYRPANQWCFDWPHWPSERYMLPHLPRVAASVDAQFGTIVEYDVRRTGLQPVFLLYYSDGNYMSQRFFERLAPRADTRPFNAREVLADEFLNGLTCDAVRQRQGGHLEASVDGARGYPLLYSGPAFKLRFEVDKQAPGKGVRLFLDPHGNFICSDWCQRDGVDRYAYGIDLQMGRYTLASWITGPFLRRVRDSFTPARASKPTSFDMRVISAREPEAAIPLAERIEKHLRHTSSVQDVFDMPLERAREEIRFRLDANKGITPTVPLRPRRPFPVPFEFVPAVMRGTIYCTKSLVRIGRTGVLAPFFELDDTRWPGATPPPETFTLPPHITLTEEQQAEAEAAFHAARATVALPVLAAADALQRGPAERQTCDACQLHFEHRMPHDSHKCFYPDNAHCLMRALAGEPHIVKTWLNDQLAPLNDWPEPRTEMPPARFTAELPAPQHCGCGAIGTFGVALLGNQTPCTCGTYISFEEWLNG